MKMWRQNLLNKLADGEIRHTDDNPRSIYAPKYLITWESFQMLQDDAIKYERERIEALLKALSTEATNPKSKNFLNLESLIAYIKGSN